MQVNVDKSKVSRMVRDILMQFNGSSVHPGELVLALSEATGRVIANVDGSDLAKRQLVDLAIKHMATTIEYAQKPVVIQ